MDHYMNPFDFVPLPQNGPIAISDDVLNQPRLEGYIEYTIKVLTPLHITGKTTKPKNQNHFDKKFFFRRAGQRVIPGASLRGMVSAFLEALTGSDLRAFTRGDEKNTSGRPAYGKWFAGRGRQAIKVNRHVGFLIASADDKSVENLRKEQFSFRGRHGSVSPFRYERNATLPNGFGQNKAEDAARFLFGHVEQNGAGRSRKGRVFFEDIVVNNSVLTECKKAWDLNSDAVFGSPNPRANTAWYFTPGGSRPRNVRGHNVWEILADKVRGRKFYFHQEPDPCHKEYRKWEKGWMRAMWEYDVEAIKPGASIHGGRVYFTDMPEALLKLLVYGLVLEEDMAHKLGALKPFGFGSVRFAVTTVKKKDMGDPFGPLGVDENMKTIRKQDLDEKLIFPEAYEKLKKILHFPGESEKRNYLFIYPPFNTRGANCDQKGFACVEEVRKNSQGKEIFPNPEKPKSYKKKTLFFDKYQKTSTNYGAVIGENP